MHRSCSSSRPCLQKFRAFLTPPPSWRSRAAFAGCSPMRYARLKHGNRHSRLRVVTRARRPTKPTLRAVAVPRRRPTRQNWKKPTTRRRQRPTEATAQHRRTLKRSRNGPSGVKPGTALPHRKAITTHPRAPRRRRRSVRCCRLGSATTPSIRSGQRPRCWNGLHRTMPCACRAPTTSVPIQPWGGTCSPGYVPSPPA